LIYMFDQLPYRYKITDTIFAIIMLILLVFQHSFQESVELQVTELEQDKPCHEFCKVFS